MRGIKFTALRNLSICLMLLLPASVVAQTSDPLPTATFSGDVTLVSPATAWSYYITQDTASPAQAVPEDDIVQLAEALGKDPDKIYAYVHDNVEILPLFGTAAGARGAYIDKAGTAFDQAQLMVRLLKASGYTASYRVGTITLTGAQFNDWLGISDANVATKFLANGGIPATVNATGATINSVTMMHMWVIVNIGGTDYAFDPSMKSHSVKSGINLDTAMAFNSTAILSAALTGAEAATDNGTARVRNMSRSGVQGQLQASSSALLTHLRNNMPEASLDDVVGGRSIVPLANGPVRQTEIGYTPVVNANYAGEIPNAFRTKVTIEFGYYDNSNVHHTANYPFYADEVYGEPLYFNEAVSKGPLEKSTFAFYRGDSPLTGYLIGTLPTPKITVNHPYAGVNSLGVAGGYMDREVNVTGYSYGTLQLVLGFGRPSRDLGAWQEQRFSPAENEMFRSYSGAQEAPSVEGMQTATKRRMGSSFLGQYYEALELFGEVNETRYQVHDTIGFVTAASFSGAGNTDGVAATTFTIGMEPSISTISLDGTASSTLRSKRGAATLLSSLEGSVSEQLGGSVYSTSAIAKMDWALDGDSNVNNRWFYLAKDTNWSWVNSQLLYDYENNSLSKMSVPLYLDDNYKVIVTRSSFLGPGPASLTYCKPHAQLTMYGYYTVPNNGACYILGVERGGSFIAVKNDNTALAHMTLMPFSWAKGGGGTNLAEIDPSHVFHKPEAFKASHFSARALASNVDLKTGALNYTPPADLVVGQGEYPYSLSFQRYYRSGSEKTDFAHDYSDGRASPHDAFYSESGWTSNLTHYAQGASEGFAALGRDDPMPATSTITAFRAIYALSDDGSSDLDFLERQITSTIVANWWVGGIGMNTMNIVQGNGSHSYYKLADGTWTPQRGIYSTLEVTNSREIVTPTVGPAWWSYRKICVKQTDKDGVKSYFGPWDTAFSTCSPPTADITTNGRHAKPYIHFKHQVFPNGVTVDQDNTGIWNSLGQRIDITKTIDFDRTEYVIKDHNNLSRQVTLAVDYNSSSDGEVGLSRLTATDVYGKTWVYENTSGFNGALPGFEVRTPLSPNKALVRYDYVNSWGKVKSLTDANNHTSLFYTGSMRVGRVADPMSFATTVYYDQFGQPIKTVDALGNVTLNTYDSMRRPLISTQPEGNGVQYYYDLRSNKVRERQFAKPSSTEATNGIQYNSYVSYSTGPTSLTCTNMVICNKPVSTTDANGNVTNYSWDSSTGDLTQVLAPAVISYDDANASIRPQTDLGYTTLGGASFLTSKTEKISNSVSVITAYTYDAANHYVLKTVKKDSGGLNLITTANFDSVGNLSSIDGPRTDVTDISYFNWDLGRRLTSAVDIDPDGAGTKPRPVTRYFYDDDGKMVRSEIGTATATNGSDFVLKNYVTTDFDAIGNPVRSFSFDSSNVIKSVTDINYDANDRTLCTAMRMNPDVFSYAKTDACVLGSSSGGYGADRITKTDYDALGHETAVTRAYNTTDVQIYVRYTYSANGKKTSEKDARGNLSQYEYNGFDRLWKLYYPNVTAGAGTYNTADYEEYLYDPNGNRTSYRRRSGQTYGFSYDALNRETLKTRTDNAALNVYSYYDLLGHLRKAQFSTAGASMVTTYDKTGRTLSVTDIYGRSVSYQYDAGSNRTVLSFPDGVVQTYGYDAANRLGTITLGAASFTPVIDNFGRVTGLNRGNGTTTNIGYDSIDQVISLGHDLLNTNNDLTWTWAYNPASQVIARSTNNSAYSYANAPVQNTAKTYDGLNRDTSIVALSGGYDANGNLSNEGSGGRAFSYDMDNHLTNISGGMGATTNFGLSYDPMGRLASTTTTTGSGTVTTQFLYDGVNLIGEYQNSIAAPTVYNMSQRYGHGLGTDQPLVAFAGTGTTAPIYLYADRQGSIIATANSTGALGDTYKYGPYGEPTNAANAESWSGQRFRYTGQTMLADAKLYYYKARVYDPKYGRFLQTDPIGSKDDLDLYAYVGGDPINHSDPTGLCMEYKCGGYGSGPDGFPIGETCEPMCLAGGGSGGSKVPSSRSGPKPAPDGPFDRKGLKKVVDKPGLNGQYTIYDKYGPLYQYRGPTLGGRHGINGPTVKEWGRADINGKIVPTGGTKVREATAREVMAVVLEQVLAGAVDSLVSKITPIYMYDGPGGFTDTIKQNSCVVDPSTCPESVSF